MALRGEAQAAAGASFDLRAFHDKLLSLGALPFSLIRKEVLAMYGR